MSEWVLVPGHPEHPPLDYQELLGLEAMGEVDYPIGKLRIRVNLRQLLDGYESAESRQRRRMSDRELELEDRHLSGIHININQENSDRRQTKTTNNFQNSIIGNFANQVQDNASQQAKQNIQHNP